MSEANPGIADQLALTRLVTEYAYAIDERDWDRLGYHDRYRRTPDGWRIAERVEGKSFDYNMPEWMRRALKL